MVPVVLVRKVGGCFACYRQAVAAVLACFEEGLADSSDDLEVR